jgi:hypothetical protein
MLMNVDQLAERELAEKTEELGGKQTQCHFFHQKSHMT